jgi:hypothetical protein
MGALSDLIEEIEHVLKGYVEAMLWANAVCDIEGCEDRAAGSDCEHSNGAEKKFSLSDFSDADQTSMRDDVEDFVLGNLADFRKYLEEREYDPSQGTVADYFGHDFALTRNGHGAGFWDRGLGRLGDRLSEASKVYGSSDIYISSDGPSVN